MCSFYFNPLKKISQGLVQILTGCFLLFILPCATHAATLAFAPASGSYEVGETFSVGVFVGSVGVEVNAVSGTVSFPTDKLEVVSISKSSSIVSLWVKEPSFSNTSGSINFEGVILNPGFTGVSGRILNVTFRAKSPSNASVTFGAGSVLANDGEGTELLSSRGSAAYKIDAKKIVVTEPPVIQTETEKVDKDLKSTIVASVNSESHPTESWSNKTTGEFNFALTDDVVSMRLLVDTKPDSVPVVVHTPPVSSRTITDIGDGISYLHVQYKDKNGWGEVLHYKLQIDRSKPDNFAVKFIDDRILLLSAADDLAGVSYYEVQIDGGEIIRIEAATSFYKLTNASVGEHTIVARAFDTAGNYTEVSHSFSVSGDQIMTPVGVVKDDPLHQNKFTDIMSKLDSAPPIATWYLLISVLIGLCLFYVWRYFFGTKKNPEKEMDFAVNLINKCWNIMKVDIETNIDTIQKTSKKRKLSRLESKVLKSLKNCINDKEKLIANEIDNTASKAPLG